jgi:hypothetical protein
MKKTGVNSYFVEQSGELCVISLRKEIKSTKGGAKSYQFLLGIDISIEILSSLLFTQKSRISFGLEIMTY